MMPPKKKSGKKGKKSGKKSGKKKETASTLAEVVDELSKEFFILHIKDLERRLVRYQKKYEELKTSNDTYADKFGELANDKKQRVHILKKSLEQRGDEIADLRDRLVGLQQAKESEKETFEAELQQLRTEFQEMKDQLTSENNVLAAKLAALEEFKVAKEGLLGKYASMEEDLQRMLESHETTLQAIDRKTVTDRDRLKKEMVMRVNQVAAEFRKVSNKQMAETTKRTIRENVSIQTQLAKMADKNAELVQDNEELKTRQRKERQQITQLERNHTELAKKNSSEARVLAMLEEKRREQEELVEEYVQREKMLSCLEEESEQMKSSGEEKREQIEAAAYAVESLQDALDSRREELSSLEGGLASAEAVLERCSNVMQALLQSVRAPGPDADSARSEDEAARTERLLTDLLDVLERRAAEPPPPGLDAEPEGPPEASEESASVALDAFERQRSAGSAPGRGIRRGSLPPLREAPEGSGRGLCAPGSLQLVPTAGRHIPTFVERTRARAGEAPEQRVMRRAVGVQTASAARAVFAADGVLRAARA